MDTTLKSELDAITNARKEWVCPSVYVPNVNGTNSTIDITHTSLQQLQQKKTTISNKLTCKSHQNNNHNDNDEINR